MKGNITNKMILYDKLNKRGKKKEINFKNRVKEVGGGLRMKRKEVLTETYKLERDRATWSTMVSDEWLNFPLLLLDTALPPV